MKKSIKIASAVLVAGLLVNPIVILDENIANANMNITLSNASQNTKYGLLKPSDYGTTYIGENRPESRIDFVKVSKFVIRGIINNKYKAANAIKSAIGWLI